MAISCVVCQKPLGIMDKTKLKDGVVCKACYQRSGLKSAGWPSAAIEVWEVCVLCEMTEDKKREYIKKKRSELSKNMETIRAQVNAPAQTPVSKCPKCGSTSISADKKGFGIGKAVVGAAVAGPVGLVAGNIGSKKVLITCLNCGHQWQAGKG